MDILKPEKGDWYKWDPNALF